MSPYKYLEHEGEEGILGIGDTPEEAFAEGAKALFNIMVQIENVEPKEVVEVFVTSESMDTLFVELLGELILLKDITGLMFSDFKVKIMEKEDGYELEGKALGEPLDARKHGIKTEVKAATYHGLKFEEKGGKYYARCVVDV